MYPVTGASGGAIRSPCERIPTQFVRREPCHSSWRLPSFERCAAASPSREARKTWVTFSLYWLCVLAWVLRTYSSTIATSSADAASRAQPSFA